MNALFGFEEYIGYLWLIAGIFLLLLEVGTPGLFVFISLSLGAFIGAATAFLELSFALQCWAALVGALISFGLLKYFFTNQKPHRTNIAALLGQEALVTEVIEPRQIGRVKVKGEEWQAQCENHHTVLHKGSVVKIIRSEGNKLIVR